MFKFLYKSLLFVAILGFASCEADVNQFDQNDDSTFVKADIFGIVTDVNNQAVQNASVRFDGHEILTNEFGVYQFNQVDVNSRHNFINITKVGFFEATRTFRTQKTTTISQKTQLLAKNFNLAFQSTSGGTVAQNNAVLEFPANAIVFDSDKSAYNGNVKVAMHYLDPSLLDLDQQMPGDLSGVDADDNYVALTSFGMVYVELQADNGQKLQIKDGSTIKMTASIPSELTNPPATIKMWYFDDAAGVWQEEGSAILDGNSYVGEVGHFSCWNYDYSAPAINLSGRVIDTNGNPVGGIHVWVSEVGAWGGGHGNTNMDGTFSGAVSKDVNLILKILDAQNCSWSDPIYEEPIGPFSVDTDIGDITVDLLAQGAMHITATVVDCNGNLVTNGFVHVANTQYLITNGILDIMVPVCNLGITHTLRAVDLNALQQGDLITVTGTPQNLGTITACGNTLDFMEIKCDALMLNNVTMAEHGFSIQQDTVKTVFGYTNSSSVEFNYGDGITNGIATGPFTIWEGNVFYDQLNTDLIFTSGVNTVTFYDPNEQYATGSYTITVMDPQTGNNYEFYGNYKLPTF